VVPAPAGQQTDGMAAYLVIGFLVLVGPLALLFGADSRPSDTRERSPWWPGHHS
jgi:hypothetical protein